MNTVGSAAGRITLANSRCGGSAIDRADLISTGSTPRTALIVFSRIGQVQA